MNLPPVTFMAGDTWTPSSEPIQLWRTTLPKPLTYENYAAPATVLGWIFLPLFLAGISGLVKRQQ